MGKRLEGAGGELKAKFRGWKVRMLQGSKVRAKEWRWNRVEGREAPKDGKIIATLLV